MITTPDAKILRVNQAFSEITGYSKDEVVGDNPSIFQSGTARCRFLPGYVVRIARYRQVVGRGLGQA